MELPNGPSCDQQPVEWLSTHQDKICGVRIYNSTRENYFSYLRGLHDKSPSDARKRWKGFSV